MRHNPVNLRLIVLPLSFLTMSGFAQIDVIPRKGEITLTGVVVAKPTGLKFLASITSFSLPSGKSSVLKEAKQKTIYLTEKTQIISRGEPTQPVPSSLLEAGMQFQAMGIDEGSGTDLVARVIAVWDEVKDGRYVLHVRPMANAASNSPSTNASVPTISATDNEKIVRIVDDKKRAVVVIHVDTAQGPATGTGFFVSSDGVVVTNHHVINGATKAWIELANGSLFIGDSILADDEKHDLALIKVRGTDMISIEIGASASLKQGQTIVVIGNPLGELKHSVSTGVVAALRGDTEQVQFTAPISSGSSGGPVLDLSGKAVGVVTSAIPPGAVPVAQNLNFASYVEPLRTLIANQSPKPFGSPLTVGKKRTDVERLCWDAWLHGLAGRKDEATRSLQQAVDGEPTSALVGFSRAYITYIVEKEPAAALELLTDPLAKNPSNADILTLYARLLFVSRRFSESVPYLERAIRADPSSVGAWLILAQSHQQLNQLANAYNCYMKVIELDPGNAYAHVVHAQNFLATNIRQGAETHFLAASQTDPDRIAKILRRAGGEWQNGDVWLAFRELDAFHASRVNAEWAVYASGRLALLRSDTATALLAYRYLKEAGSFLAPRLFQDIYPSTPTQAQSANLPPASIKLKLLVVPQNVPLAIVNTTQPDDNVALRVMKGLSSLGAFEFVAMPQQSAEVDYWSQRFYTKEGTYDKEAIRQMARIAQADCVWVGALRLQPYGARWDATYAASIASGINGEQWWGATVNTFDEQVGFSAWQYAMWRVVDKAVASVNETLKTKSTSNN